MQNPTQYLVIIILILYAIIRRVMRAVNFQKYNKTQLMFRIGLYAIIAFILLAVAILNPISYLYFGIGAALGVGLVYVALKNILFEKRKDGLYYRTHVWVEVALMTIFFGRVAYRFYVIYNSDVLEAPENMSDKLEYAKDPLIGWVFFLLCTYYIGYYYSVNKMSEKVLREPEDTVGL